MDGNRRNRATTMSQERASEVGFCVVDDNADLIAETLVRRIRDAAAEVESEVNRLYRGRNAYDLNGNSRQDLERTIRRLDYLTRTLRDVQEAQGRVAYLHAAE
jgi:hypothetical protein